MIVNTDGTITAQNTVPAGIAPAGSAVEIILSGDANTLTIQTVGTYTGALSLQGTVDGTSWITLGGTQLQNINTGAFSSTIASATQGIFQSNVSGFTKARVTGLATMTGSVKVSLSASNSSALVGVGAPLPTGSSTIGSVNALQVATASNLTTTTSVNSAASTNAANVKTTAGTVYALTANNTSAAAKFIRLYNKASAPTVGTDTPVLVLTIPANSSQTYSFGGVGLRFATGIGHAITNAAAVLDATAVAAGDVQLTYTWI